MAGNSRCGKINVLGQWKSSKKFESVKVSLHFVLLSLPLALKKKTKHFWLDKKRFPDFYIIYIWQRGLVFRKNLRNSMLRYPCPYLVLVVNQIGTRLSENPGFFVLYASAPLGWSAFMFSQPVTAWWCWARLSLVFIVFYFSVFVFVFWSLLFCIFVFCFFVFFVTTWWWAGLSLVARFAIGLFARWVSKAWWNVFARPFPISEKKCPSHCLVRFLNPLVSAPPPNRIGTLNWSYKKSSCKRYVIKHETFHAPNKHFAFRGLK